MLSTISIDVQRLYSTETLPCTDHGFHRCNIEGITALVHTNKTQLNNPSANPCINIVAGDTKFLRHKAGTVIMLNITAIYDNIQYQQGKLKINDSDRLFVKSNDVGGKETITTIQCDVPQKYNTLSLILITTLNKH